MINTIPRVGKKLLTCYVGQFRFVTGTLELNCLLDQELYFVPYCDIR